MSCYLLKDEYSRFLCCSLVAASPQRSVATSIRTRRCGTQGEDWLGPTQTAPGGAMTNSCFATPVTHARLVCWLASRRAGGRSQWSTLLWWSSSSLSMSLLMQLIGTTARWIMKSPTVKQGWQRHNLAEFISSCNYFGNTPKGVCSLAYLS